jgi:hypothetical protein
VWPGWQVLPFLTDGTPQVLSLLNIALATGIALNATYLAYDAPWFKTLGYFVASTIGLAVLVRARRVLPFGFTGWAVLLTHAAMNTPPPVSARAPPDRHARNGPPRARYLPQCLGF